MSELPEYNFLKNSGILLYTGKYALSKKKAIEYINLLNDKYFILGGDLYIKKNNKLSIDAANWYTEPCSNTIKDSVDNSLKFINKFHESDDLFFVFTIKYEHNKEIGKSQKIDLLCTDMALILDDNWVQCYNKSCEEVFQVNSNEEFVECPKCFQIQLNPLNKDMK